MQALLFSSMPRVFAILVALISSLAFLPAHATRPAQDRMSGPRELRRKAAAGEECIVCGQLIVGGEVVELRMGGRKFFVASTMLEDFLKDPERYFKKLRAQSALFDEVGTDVGLGDWPFWIGVYALTGMVFAALCGYLAVSSGIPPVPWFFAGLIGNLAALFVLLAARRSGQSWVAPPGLAKVPNTVAPVACKDCGAPNHPSAERCAGCGAGLAPVQPSEASLLRSSRP